MATIQRPGDNQDNIVKLVRSVKPMMIDGHCRHVVTAGSQIEIKQIATLKDHVLCQVLDGVKMSNDREFVFILPKAHLDNITDPTTAGSTGPQLQRNFTSGLENGFERRMVDKRYEIAKALEVCDHNGKLRTLETGQRVRIQCKTSSGLLCLGIGGAAEKETFVVVERNTCQDKMAKVVEYEYSTDSDSDEEDLEAALPSLERRDSVFMGEAAAVDQQVTTARPQSTVASIASNTAVASPSMSLAQMQQDAKDKTKIFTVDLKMLQEWFDAMSYYDWAPIPAHTSKFFLHAKNKSKLRPAVEPRMIESAKTFSIANGPQYIYTAMAAAVADPVIHEGSDQCKACSSGGFGRFTGCITIEAYDDDGKQVFEGSCLRCVVNSKLTACSKSRLYTGN